MEPESIRRIVDPFHTLYYDSKVWTETTWFGVRTQKCPVDLWIYQEIIYELRPDVIIETGTLNGGSALFLASLCDLLKKGKVITIDISNKKARPRHPRIQYLLGSSISEGVVEGVSRMLHPKDIVMVILDSDHSKNHVLHELRTYSRFVTRGSYLIVEDTNIDGHPVYPEFGPGPMEAVEEFLKETNEFVVDSGRERLYLTFNPRGYLRKIA